MPQAVEMGKISFNYLPASPLNNGWRPALKDKPALTAFVPSDRADGLSIRAEDAIDFDVEKHQRVCNHVQFFAKLTHDSYVYAKIEVVSRDTHTVSRRVWIACDSGDKPPRKVSRDEWVIHRMPQQDGWTKFDLSLPEEVAGTYGQAEGLQFSELFGFRLRGVLSISPISLSRVESDEMPTSELIPVDETVATSTRPWSRGDKIAFWSLLTLILTAFLLVLVPEARRFLHLEKSPDKPPTPSTITPSASVESNEVFATNVAEDVEGLRQEDRVTELPDSESEKTFAEIPVDSYGYVDGIYLPHEPLDQIRVETTNFSHFFEIHKVADGSGRIVGYVGPETFQRLREGVAPGSGLTLYSASWKEAPNIVAIPIKGLKCHRSRTVEEGNTLRGTEIRVLDCEAN